MEQEVSDIVLFLGRFHPLVLHLPIGFLVMAFILEIASRFKRFEKVGSAAGFVLLLGAASAALAAVLGYLLAQAGGYNEEMLAIHQWSGIGVAVASGCAYLLKWQHDRNPSQVVDRAYLSLLSIMMLTLAVAGHYGGSLTHGSDYLTQYMPNGLRTVAGLPPKEEKGFKEITNIQEAQIYSDIVDPILETRCTSCHNETKSKGELQMHTRELLLKGGESGPAFVEGNAGESEMIRRIFLPETHDDHMPPEGKRPLTDAHKELLEWWVSSGAPFDKKVAEVEVSEEVQSALNTLVDPQADMSPAEKLLASEVAPANAQVLVDLEKQGIDIRPVATGSNWLQVDVPRNRSVDSLMSGLREVSTQITWLDLGDSIISDTALVDIGNFTNLTRLHLPNTGVTDKGLTHLTGLSNLELLNLYGTEVTDEGIQQLKKLPHLRKFFVWQTGVTPEGAQELENALPGLEVNLGLRDTTGVATAEVDK
ncbi:c-type cytochrome domain-containing protein [Halalkalibaculum sp. DA3122]|uniref:c-type cytochrome domain-containing protein n=1 Tax=Halalkalibaculum sp. DA3122 TaxID=3373607 RepID=UPI0037542ABC